MLMPEKKGSTKKRLLPTKLDCLNLSEYAWILKEVGDALCQKRLSMSDEELNQFTGSQIDVIETSTPDSARLWELPLEKLTSFSGTVYLSASTRNWSSQNQNINGFLETLTSQKVINPIYKVKDITDDIFTSESWLIEDLIAAYYLEITFTEDQHALHWFANQVMFCRSNELEKVAQIPPDKQRAIVLDYIKNKRAMLNSLSITLNIDSLPSVNKPLTLEGHYFNFPEATEINWYETLQNLEGDNQIRIKEVSLTYTSDISFVSIDIVDRSPKQRLWEIKSNGRLLIKGTTAYNFSKSAERLLLECLQKNQSRGIAAPSITADHFEDIENDSEAKSKRKSDGNKNRKPKERRDKALKAIADRINKKLQDRGFIIKHGDKYAKFVVYDKEKSLFALHADALK